ncbi:MAG: hypothetical protein AYK19_18070 [Theionarchaea archaeon DG-70-1]|nr:MAG: hypothetical protein AYK19_18070 [Theionarchaea archaeon DG-70-1]
MDNPVTETFLWGKNLTYTMCSGESKGHKEVDTLRVALLGFSLVSAIVFAYLVAYFMMYSMVDYPDDMLSRFSPEDMWVIHSLKTLMMFMFILPLITSFVVWYVTPTFIRVWYSLRPLPIQYGHVYSLAQEIASKMGISPPAILYATENLANCFNLGKREGESTIVVSKWLVTHLDDEELKAVLAHEIAHTKNRDVTLMAYFAAARRTIFISPLFILLGFLYIFLPVGVPISIFLFSLRFWALIIVVFLVYFPLALGIQWFSRLREIAADARASLVVDKNVLKRTLYRLASAKSTRMLFASSCLMMFSSKKLGGILSTHPDLYRRFDTLEKDSYITDLRNPPSFRLLFTYAVGILLVIQLADFAVGTPLYFMTGYFLHGAAAHILNALLVAALFIVYYDYISWNHIGIVIILVSLLRIMIVLLIVIPSSFALRQFVLPVIGSIEAIPSLRMRVLLLYMAVVGQDLPNTLISNLKGVISFAIITFLMTIFLKYTKKYVKS